MSEHIENPVEVILVDLFDFQEKDNLIYKVEVYLGIVINEKHNCRSIKPLWRAT